MNDDLEKWQTDYQQSTPKLDIKALQAEVQTSRNKERLKVGLELILSIAVSAFCIYASLVFASGYLEQMLFMALSPIPIAFSIWILWQQQQSNTQNSLSVDALIQEKQAKLHRQLRYWKASFIVLALLWTLALVLTIWSYLMARDTSENWLFICVVQAPILLFTIARYHYLKKRLAIKLEKLLAYHLI